LEKRGIENLVTSHADISAVLGISGELTFSEVAEKINRDRSTVTSLVSKLENLGYVRKRENDIDKRSSFLSLTKKGEGLSPNSYPSPMLYLRKRSKASRKRNGGAYEKYLKGCTRIFRNNFLLYSL
jgi:DNA-binding MarR family transcriptional regulator